MPMLPRHRPRPFVLLASGLLLAMVLAACSSPGSDSLVDGSADGSDDDLVAVGTEAWDSEAPATGDPADDIVAPDAAGTPTTGATQDPTGAGAVDPGAAGTPGSEAPATGDSSGPLDPRSGIDAIVAAMTVEQKVGQLFTVTVIGNDATDPSPAARTANSQLFGVETPAEVVAAYHLGGVAYFDHDLGEGTSNVDDVLQVAAFSAGLQQAAADDTGIGLLIGADQEGGNVVRLRAPATVFPSARAIGNTGDLELARQVGMVTGTEARALGVNWVYAPVADVNVNPDNPVIGDRAFAVETSRTSQFVAATAEGLAEAGVLPTLKHFPGHGDTAVDSHSSLPTIDHDIETLRAVDLPPFQLAAQDPTRTSVMVAHLAVPAVDAEGLPATISSAVMNLLRGDVGFDGLVVTDAMNMGALSGFGDAGSLAVQAIAAGIDVVLMPTDLPAAQRAVLAAVADGTIPEGRLDVSVRRVLEAKQVLGVLDASTIATPSIDVVGSAAHQDVRDRVRAACSC